MRKTIKNIFISLLSILMMLAPLAFRAPVFADEESTADNCYHGAILDNICDDGEGGGVIEVLKIVIRVFTIGIGIFAAVGITIVGIQYLTAGANEEQTRKAKRRLIEIVIGIAAYVVIYALLIWLLPGFDGIIF